MKTQILKKVNQRVRIVEDDGEYMVQRRKTVGFGMKFGDWETINTLSSYKKALKKKEIHIVMVVMRELGYRREFVRRRTETKKRLGII